jgi:hypothetical protein
MAGNLGDALNKIQQYTEKMRRDSEELEPTVAWLEQWIAAYRQFQKGFQELPNTSQSTPVREQENTNQQQGETPTKAELAKRGPRIRPPASRRTVDYLLRVLRDANDYLDFVEAGQLMKIYGWDTTSETRREINGNLRATISDNPTWFDVAAGKIAITDTGRKAIEQIMRPAINTRVFVVEEKTAEYDQKEIDRYTSSSLFSRS